MRADAAWVKGGILIDDTVFSAAVICEWNKPCYLFMPGQW